MANPRSQSFEIIGPDQFRQNQLPRVALDMLCYVFMGSWDKLRQLSEAYPEAMFAPLSLDDEDSDSAFKFSVASFAIYAYDLCALEILMRILKGSHYLAQFLKLADEFEAKRNDEYVVSMYSRILAEFSDSVPSKCYGGLFSSSLSARKQYYTGMILNLKGEAPELHDREVENKGCLFM